jgi:hypothetical protein
LWAKPNTNGYRDANGNGDAYRYTETFTYTADCADAETASHATASAVRRGFNGIVFLRGLAMFASPRKCVHLLRRLPTERERERKPVENKVVPRTCWAYKTLQTLRAAVLALGEPSESE